MSMAGYIADRTAQDVLKAIKSFEGQRVPLRVSATEIAELIGCSVITAYRAIYRLEKTGQLKISNQIGQPNCYEFPEEAG